MQEIAEKIEQSQTAISAQGETGAVEEVASPNEMLEYLVGEVRKQVRKVFIDAAESEFRSFVGAERYERSNGRKDQRNGSRPRDMVTEIGTLSELPIPRARKGNFLPSFFGRWRSEERRVGKECRC